MAEAENTPNQNQRLEQDTYNILKSRLQKQAEILGEKLNKLNLDRKQTFGSVETKLLANERITTDNNCLARDMIPVGNYFIFGYNVHMGLKKETGVKDVFSVYEFNEGRFQPVKESFLGHPQFTDDFINLYKYYKLTQFAKFAVIGPHLFMVFQVGKSADDIKVFKWRISGQKPEYIDNRSEHEFKYPEQHQFQWKKVTRDMQRKGLHPHISIEDRVFVETIGGDLTIKIEDNTDTGEGIYSEPVDEPDQTLDDADISYALLNNIIVLRIKPYQETQYRYIVFNEKVRKAQRIDALEDACVLLPDDQGIIFPKGYYLQTGVARLFEINQQNMYFEKSIASPNGEDFLYIFYNKVEGIYILLSYNIISQDVATPIVCNGFSLFHNGQLIYFKTDSEQKKHHAVQIWQTPYYHPDYEPESIAKDSAVAKIGNKEIVRGMAECHELINLLNKEDSYNDLYVDLVRKSGEILDSYHWLAQAETHALAAPLQAIKETANAALDEFEKVQKIRENTQQQLKATEDKIAAIKSEQRKNKSDNINHYVHFLAEYRKLRGEIIALKDLRYVNLQQVESFENHTREQSEILSEKCISFLLGDNALQPYQEKLVALDKAIDEVAKVVEANKLEKEITAVSNELEMLIEIVSNLKIEDATQTTRIIDGISALYANFNKSKTLLKRRRKDLLGAEGKAEFHAQIGLLEQGIVNFLDIADTPQKCDEYLTKLMVQTEELESKFAEFNEFVAVLTEKREEIYAAFEGKKVSLIEKRNQRTNTLFESALRILNGIAKRLEGYKTIAEINGYLAGDLMVEKVRNIITELSQLEDSVKADDLQSRLKNVKEDAVRQLKDKTELFSAGGENIKLGRHNFSVNNQNLDLTTVIRSDGMYYHLTGTNFFEKITDKQLNEAKVYWNQAYVSENEQVYRAEYLAYQVLQKWLAQNNSPVEQLEQKTPEQLQQLCVTEMNSRYNEGYVKSMHDHDAARILQALVQLHLHSDFLKYTSVARACAALFWHAFLDEKQKNKWQKRLKGAGVILQVFPNTREFKGLQQELANELQGFNQNFHLFDIEISNEAAEYLFFELARDDEFVIDADAAKLYEAFSEYLQKTRHKTIFENSIKTLSDDPVAHFRLLRQWLTAFVENNDYHQWNSVVDECAQLLFSNTFKQSRIINTPMHRLVTGLQGEHKLIINGEYTLHYNEFNNRLRTFCHQEVPAFLSFQALKKTLVDDFKKEIKLQDFKPGIMSSFVRNKLIDEVYLPIIGDNLAKQIGTTGADKRTDRMGMLLLLSPPGYGKTTLMEYIANRLGIIFIKINGPAIGHKITSVDPAEAQNAAAKQEVEKLNLAFEMGDNIMIYLDDIQHCNPEFLQKFISLCDATRKIEGVYKGQPKTYDFRGKKVCVVMAGNPYTESGEKFQIPDMLANRADIYNLGDIIGDSDHAFKLSYVENALTSNPVLAKLASKSQKDVYTLIKIAEGQAQEGLDFEANHSAEEINEYVSVLKKLLAAREVVYKVNQQYIASAAQSEAYRTEPAFELQGSYRNMNKLAEKIAVVMNHNELNTLILSHYENECQTLTSHAEANFLKFKELINQLSPEEKERWNSIKQTFVKQNSMTGLGKDQQVAQLISQMSHIIEGLGGIETALSQDKYFLKVKNISKIEGKEEQK
ncbi:AAA family ATPase [bacterium]|nr:AAA family ATPase [bacterium]